MPRKRNHLAHINAALQTLTSELIRLVQDTARSAGRGRGAKPGRATATKKARKPQRPISPKVRRLRQQQGQFMGLVRTLPKNKREPLKKLRREKGYGVAIAAARKIR